MGELHRVSRWGADSLLGRETSSTLQLPLNGYPYSLHTSPSFPQEVLPLSLNSWERCPRTQKNADGRVSVQVVFDLDVLRGLSNPVPMAMWNIPRILHPPRVQVVPFFRPRGCILWPYPSSGGSGGRSSTGFAGLFLTLGHIATTGPPSSSWVTIVKISLSILTTTKPKNTL